MVNNVLRSFVSVELIRTNRSTSSDTCVSPALSHNPFRIRTYEKRARNSFRIRTYKTQDLKSFRIRTYKKRRGGGVQTVNQNLLHRGAAAHGEVVRAQALRSSG